MLLPCVTYAAKSTEDPAMLSVTDPRSDHGAIPIDTADDVQAGHESTIRRDRECAAC